MIHGSCILEEPKMDEAIRRVLDYLQAGMALRVEFDVAASTGRSTPPLTNRDKPPDSSEAR